LLFDIRKIGFFQTEARGIIECRSTVNKKMGSNIIIKGWLKPGPALRSFDIVGLIASGFGIYGFVLLF